MTVDDLRSGGGDSNYKSGSMRTRVATLDTKGVPGVDIYLSCVDVFLSILQPTAVAYDCH